MASNCPRVPGRAGFAGIGLGLLPVPGLIGSGFIIESPGRVGLPGLIGLIGRGGLGGRGPIGGLGGRGGRLPFEFIAMLLILLSCARHSRNCWHLRHVVVYFVNTFVRTWH
jgi:hypothetical protein